MINIVHPPRRSACDRCHAHKQRCPIKPDEEICSRCLKAGTLCVFGPSMRGLRPNSETRKEMEKLPAVSMSSLSSRQMVPSSSNQPSIEPADPRGIQITSAAEAVTSAYADPHLLGQSFDSTSMLDIGNLTPYFHRPVPQLNSEMWTPTIMSQHINENEGSAMDESHGSLNQGSQSDLNIEHDPEYCSRISEVLENTLPSHNSVAPTSSPGNALQPHKRRKTFSPQRRIQDGSDSSRDSVSRGLYHVRELARINVLLYEYTALIPPIKLCIRNPNMTRGYDEFRLDDILHLTETFINLYPLFIHSFVGRSYQEAQQKSRATSDFILGHDVNVQRVNNNVQPHNQVHHQQEPPQPRSQARQETDNGQPFNVPCDTASILLLLSCHLRLFDLYERIFEHTRYCFKEGVIFIPIVVPSVSMGTYTPPPAAVATMHVMMVIQSAGRLLTSVHDFVEPESLPGLVVFPSENEPVSEHSRDAGWFHTGQDASVNTLGAACAAVRDRAKEMTERVNVLRHEAFYSFKD